MSDYEELMALTRPGREFEVGADHWLVMRRSYRQDPGSDWLSFTVELVRAGSDADPRQIHPTPPREDT